MGVPRLQTESGKIAPVHLSFCSVPFGLEQLTLGIASVPQETKQFIALNGEMPARPDRPQAKVKQQRVYSVGLLEFLKIGRNYF